MKELIQGLDGPRTAQQELFYDLEDTAAVIGWAVTELAAITATGSIPSHVQALTKITTLLSAQQQKLGLYASEVKAQRITRRGASPDECAADPR